MTTFIKNFFFLIFLLLLPFCLLSVETMKSEKEFPKGTFGYDLTLLKKALPGLILLENSDGKAKIAISPEYQGRVMTSTSEGLEGESYGWINGEKISKKELSAHINAFGGEDRFWLGPEGGQFSIFFNKGKEQIFENWYTPASLDSEPFEVLSSSKNSAKFGKTVIFENYSGTNLKVRIDREVRLLSHEDFEKLFKFRLEKEISFVGFESVNSITNSGDKTWDKKGGTVSIWILGMFNATDNNSVLFPFKEGSDEKLGKILTDDYFGKIGRDRLFIDKGIIYFKGDGKFRSKIGMTSKRASEFIASFDTKKNLLTLVNYPLSKCEDCYVNSLWQKEQKEPFKGDAINSYNDGPNDTGKGLGQFFELESSSQAAFLEKGQKMTHTHRTFHFKGSFESLNKLATHFLKTDLTAFVILQIF